VPQAAQKRPVAAAPQDGQTDGEGEGEGAGTDES
jgi:hypothetical protein